MDTIAIFLMASSAVVFVSLLSTYIYRMQKHSRWLNQIFHLYDSELIADRESTKKVQFKLKLLQAGITKKQFNELAFVSVLAGLSLFSLIFILNLSVMAEISITVISILVAVFTPYLYIEEQIKARIKRIDDDLSVFIDLLIIILEGGGGLNNAIDEVTKQAANVIGKDLIEESKRFKYELITYGSSTAFSNLVKRTGSEAMGTIVGYMKLSEETGIGVKTIFENQAKEIRQSQSIAIKKRAAMMNIYITFTMFIFILPAIIAMMAFPLANGALMKLF